MRALQVRDHSEKPVFLDRSMPTLAANQILIRTATCALNFADLLMIRGTYQETPCPPLHPWHGSGGRGRRSRR